MFVFVTAQGSCVLVYKEEMGDMSSGTKDEPLVLSLVGWRGIKSVRAYVPTNDCVHYLRLCGEDVSRYGMYNACAAKREIYYTIQRERERERLCFYPFHFRTAEIASGNVGKLCCVPYPQVRLTSI